MVKQNTTLTSDNIVMGGDNPLYTMLDEHRKQFMIDNKRFFEAFQNLTLFENQGEHVARASEILRMYMKTYRGLDTVMFILMEWGKASRLFDNNPIRIHHFLLLFILFATRQLASVDGNVNVFFNKIDEQNHKLTGEEAEQISISEQDRSVMV